jgi:hypothetical protein
VDGYTTGVPNMLVRMRDNHIVTAGSDLHEKQQYAATPRYQRSIIGFCFEGIASWFLASEDSWLEQGPPPQLQNPKMTDDNLACVVGREGQSNH